MARIFFEDFKAGEVGTYGPRAVDADEIKAFARLYDPQPFHLDDAAGRASLLGGLAASGWHSAGLLMRLNCDDWLNDAAALGSPGVEELSWLKPVRPGDVLTARRTILDARPLRTRPGVGLVTFAFDLVNQRGETAMTQRGPILFRLRDAAPAAPGSFDRPPSGAPEPHPVLVEPLDVPLAFEEHEPGGPEALLGLWRVGREEVVDFARAYDPQPFHLSEEGAKATPFGRLAASGWQTACQWMRRSVDARAAAMSARRALGRPAPDAGPSPGVRNLKWPRPVFIGDEVRFMTRCLDKRRASRPGWGVVTYANRAVNQHGDVVLEFDASVFTPTAQTV